MKYLPVTLLCTGLLAGIHPAPAAAGTGVIERACNQSNRSASSPSLCQCIQKVANQSLNRTDRKKVAKFFDDPHAAQEVRQSDRHSDEKLWLRYKAFGEKARATCS
ncbi:MAG: hypothetical protein ACU0BB_01025 [Paracoccaceae bacterium]